MLEDGARDRGSVDAFFTAAYKDLRARARLVLRSDRSATINPTALVNEAYLKMTSFADFESIPESRRRGITARAMRQILVEAARRRQAKKREALMVSLSEEDAVSPAIAHDTLIVNSWIEKLNALNSRCATIAEMRIFGGFKMAEIAVSLEVSKATVERDWFVLRAWLEEELGSQQ
jgi:RNA polymerase sigma factor (TIGR02999 family)